MTQPTADPLETAYQAALAAARDRSAALEGPSLWEEFGQLPASSRARVFARFSVFDQTRLFYAWASWARPKQIPVSTSRFLFWLMGRGYGKSRSAAERVRDRVYAGAQNLCFIGPKMGDVEKYMIGTEGAASGLLQVFHPEHRPVYRGNPYNTIRFHTGASGVCVSAETPEFRGANLDTVWCDELAQWRFLETLWANMEFSARALSAIPVEIIITTTPLPLKFLRELVADPDCTTFIGKSDENRNNVDQTWLRRMRAKHSGTRLGSQELDAEILGDNPDSMFPQSIWDATRVEFEPKNLRRVVSVDPAIATDRKNDDTGIVGVGADDDRGLYVWADATGKYRPEEWGKKTVDMYDAGGGLQEGGCEAIVGERNRGGDLVEANVRAAYERKRGGIAAKALKFVNVHATRGKAIRAEPVSSLQSQGFLHIVGKLSILESETSDWNPKLGGRSPNRLDALVWGCWYLAGLDDEEKADKSAGFIGLEQAQAQLARPEASPSAPVSSLAWSLPSDHRGDSL